MVKKSPAKTQALIKQAAAKAMVKPQTILIKPAGQKVIAQKVIPGKKLPFLPGGKLPSIPGLKIPGVTIPGLPQPGERKPSPAPAPAPDQKAAAPEKGFIAKNWPLLAAGGVALFLLSKKR